MSFAAAGGVLALAAVPAPGGPTDAVTLLGIELYEKRDGRWLRVGNVSNFKEPR